MATAIPDTPTAVRQTTRPSATEWDTLLAGPDTEQLLWATLLDDGRVAAMTPEGPKVLGDDGWLPATSLELPPPPEGAFEVRDDCHIVQRRSGRDFGQPTPHRSHDRERCTERERARQVFSDAAGLPIAAVGPRGHLLRFRSHRQVMGHTSETSGARGYFVRDRGAGWQPVNVNVPDVLMVLPTTPPRVIGRHGDVAAIVPGTDFDRGEAIVTIARPRALAALELADGSLLIVRADGLRLLTGGSARPVLLDDAGRRWLAETTRRAVENSASRLLLIALGGQRALLASDKGLLFVDGTRAEHRRLDAPGGPTEFAGELWGLVATGTSGDWVGLTHNGQVLRGHGSDFELRGSLTDVAGPDVSHPIGAFRGADGRVRLLDHGRALVCVRDAGLEACGPMVGLRLRALLPLIDGVLIDDQAVRTWVVDQAGHREVPLALPRLHHAYYAGRSDFLFALSDGVVRLLRDGQWRDVVDLPEGALPLWFTVTPSGSAIVGLDGGEVLGRALEGPDGGWR